MSGTLVDEGRQLVSNEKWVYADRKPGWIKYEVAVDREGNVTSARVVDTNIKSTPIRMGTLKYANRLKFEKGNHYPKFHHAIVKFTLIVPKD